MTVEAGLVETLRAKFGAVLPHLDERQQRLVMAGEARSLGHGGIAAVASASGASRSRVSQGVAELEAGEEAVRGGRRGGGVGWEGRAGSGRPRGRRGAVAACPA